MADDEGYLLDNRQGEAGRRFDAFAELFDPVTFRRLAALGIAAGWRVWEVGAGGPSVPAWLARQVGPEGRVLATDIDTRWLGGIPGVEVLRHDVGTEPAPAGTFDLVHARLLLVHVPNRDEALAQLVSALRPGGRLVVEEADPPLQPLVCLEDRGPAEQRANRLKSGFRRLLADRGVDLAYGRTLPRRLRDRLIAAGIATSQEIDEHLVAVAGGTLDLATSPMITAWGRRADPGLGAERHAPRPGRPIAA